MKAYFYFVLVLLITVGCNPEDDQLTVQQVQQNINVGIVLPLKNRDYSFHNYGDYGVYEIPTDQKNFKAKIGLTGDLGVSPSNLKVKWISNIDGELFVGNPNDNFESTLTTVLSKGLHTISFEVYLGDNPELLQKDTIVISNVIKLEATPQFGRFLRLNWTKYEGSDFVSYLIYRDGNQPIAEISDINTLQYDYTQNYFLTETYPYQIVVKTSNPNWQNETLGSNIVSKAAGDFLSIPYYIRKMVKDPIRHKL